MEYLKGHTSPETAYVVDDYPYGFRLRCKIRYWLEWKKGKGFRLVSQTTNPKRPGEVWNKPKASTYGHGPAVMVKEDNGYITWSYLTYAYGETKSLENNLAAWRSFMPEEAVEEAERYVRVKTLYDEKKATGMDYRQAGAEAVEEVYQIEHLGGGTVRGA